MNVSASQCGSGCESGWTLYLDESSYSQTRCHQSFGGNFDEEEYGGKGARFEEEEEDLSMVSDASSGPRHYCEDHSYEEFLDENGSFFSASSSGPRVVANKSSCNSKKKIKQHGGNQHHNSYLDDTASSPVINFSKKNCKKEGSMDVVDFSQGFSGTHFKGKSVFQKKFGFLKSGKSGPKDAGGFQARNWE